MREKFKTLLSKINKRIMYSKCYSDMESEGIAVFCMCSGKWKSDNTLYKQCENCRYFRDIRSYV